MSTNSDDRLSFRLPSQQYLAARDDIARQWGQGETHTRGSESVLLFCTHVALGRVFYTNGAR